MDGKEIHLGFFSDDFDGAHAYDDFIRVNDLDRRLNFPDPEPENLIPNTRLIRLLRKMFAVVDEDMFDELNKYDWHIHDSNGMFYAARHDNSDKDRKMIKMHSQIMKVGDDSVVDHINGNGLHSYRSNMRACTSQQNSMNAKPKNRTSKFKGVCWKASNKKWCATIGFNYKKIHIGYFKLEEDAARAHDVRARELHGEFAWLNFPNETQP
jgi:hypothetical protein